MNPLFRTWARIKAALTSIVFPGGTPWWQSLRVGGNTRRNFSSVEPAGNGIVMSCLMWVARAFPGAPLTLKKRKNDGSVEQLHQHPMLSLIENPNPYYSGILLWMATLMSYNLTGNAYWLKIRNRARIPIALVYIPHFLIEPIGNATTYIDHYEYKPSNKDTFDIDPADVVHFRFGIDPYNMRKGLSPLASVLREIATDEEASNYTISLLLNMGITGMIIAPKSENTQPTPDDVAATKAYVQQEFTGDKRGTALVLGAPVDVTTLGFNPEQMNAKSLHQFVESRVAAAMGVPAVVAQLGVGLEHSTFNNFGEAREAAYESNIIPTQMLFAAELKTQLLPDFENDIAAFIIDWDLSNVRVLQEDQNAIWQRVDRAVAAGRMTVRRAKELTGEPAEDADEYYLRPINIIAIPASDPLEQQTAPPATQPGAASYLPRRAGRKSPDPERLMRQFAADQRRLERLFSADLERNFDQLGERAARAARALKSAAVPVHANGNGHSKEIDPADGGIVAEIVAAMLIDDWLSSDITPDYTAHYTRAWTLTTDTVSAFLGIDLGIGLDDPVAVRFIRDGGRRVGLLDIQGETRTALFQALADAREQQLGVDATARLIRQHVSVGRFRGVLAERGEQAALQARALVIARTEAMEAQRASSLLAYEASDVVTGVIAYDNRTGFGDSDCVARDGQVFAIEDARRVVDHPQGTLAWAPRVGD